MTENPCGVGCLYDVVSVTGSHAQAFHALIQEQSIAHASESVMHDPTLPRRLVQAVAGGMLGAFLIVDRLNGNPVTAVTYYDCFTHDGRGLYLEDIVTTASSRRHGLGHKAMEALARVTLARGGDALRWECAAHNFTAQRFYDHLGGIRLDHRTWRLERSMQRAVLAEAFVFRDVSAAESLWPIQEPLPPSLRVVGLFGSDGSSVAQARIYRSFSTFQGVPGVHVEALWVRENRTGFAMSLLRCIEDNQAATGACFMDATVTPDTASWLAPALQQRGFVPLAYGGDRMIARQLGRAALEALAARGDTRAGIAPDITPDIAPDIALCGGPRALLESPRL